MKRTAIILGSVLALAAVAFVGSRLMSASRSVVIPRPAPEAELDSLLRDVIDSAVDLVEQNLTTAAAWINLGLIYDANGLEALAGDAYQRGLELDDSTAKWWYWKALNQDDQGDLESAIRFAGQAMRQDPGYTPARVQRGLWRLKMGQFEEALADLEEARIQRPDDLSSMVALARIQLELDEVQVATDLLNTVVLRSSEYTYARLLLGTAYRRLGRHQEAEIELSLARDAEPSYEDPWRHEIREFRAGYSGILENADHLVARGRAVEAIFKLRQLRAEYPGDVVVLNKLAEALISTRMNAEAKKLLVEAIRIKPEHVLSHLKLSNIHLAEGMLPQAIAEAREATRLNPDYGTAHRQLGRLLTLSRDFAGAADALELATQNGRQEPDLAMSLGSILCNLQRWQDAREVFQRLVQNTPQSAEARYLLALSAGELGDFTSALPMFQRAVELDPAHARRGAVASRLRYLYEESLRVDSR